MGTMHHRLNMAVAHVFLLCILGVLSGYITGSEHESYKDLWDNGSGDEEHDTRDSRSGKDIFGNNGNDDDSQSGNSDGNEAVRDVVDQFLSIVEQYERNKENCTPGVDFNLGEGVITQYGVIRFRQQAELAVNRANFLTRIWKNGDENVLTQSEYFFYTQVRSMVEGDRDVFAAGNCYDFNEFNNYTLFCPFAYRMPNDTSMVMVKDLSVEYKYLGNESEFFFNPKINAEKKLASKYNETKGFAMYRINGSMHSPPVEENSINILYEDGHWSKPYFDCKGGDIWMMTYTVPMFGFRKGRYYFKGTSGIDIDLQKVDIDQCPSPAISKVPNVFEGSDKCKEETTKCVPVPGLGFRRGSYKCECKKGFYFPDLTILDAYRYFNGTDIEYQHERKMRGEPNQYDTYYQCIPCAPGCDTCKDGSACILELNWIQRSIVLGVSCLIICFIPVLMWFTYRYRDVKVLKAASPMLLRIILLGALLLYSPLIVNYFEPTEISCSVRMWMREIGFSISYGALLLKTWRISVVFRVRSAQRIKISDTDLIKRLILIVLLFAAYLSVRMVVGRPRVVKGTHTSGLHAYQCSWDVWDYCAAIAELCLLLWGIRLCIVVRKAPSEFNESRFISWAIYNETLLSLFLNITMFFLQSPANPDLLYLVLFIHSQLTTTVTLAFLFGSKAYVVFKYSEKEQPPTTIRGGSKYVAAPKSSCTHMSTLNSSTANSMGEKLYDDPAENSTNSMEKDIQDEFKRLYMQLEMLKQRNMKLGNPHLSVKLSAMTEAAKRETESPPPSPPTCMNGKRVVINLDEFKDGTSL